MIISLVCGHAILYYSLTRFHPHSLALDIHPCNSHHPQYSIPQLLHDTNVQHVNNVVVDQSL